MKKGFILCFIIVTTLMAGCKAGNVIPELQVENYEKVLSEAYLGLANSNIEDAKMFSEQTRLVSRTLEKGDYTVRFIFQDSERGITYELEPISFQMILANDNEYVKLISAKLTIAILQQVGDAHGRIIGSILNWKKDKFWTGLTEYFVGSLNTEEWAYGSKYPMYLNDGVDGIKFSSLGGNKPVKIESGGSETIKDLEKILDKK